MLGAGAGLPKRPKEAVGIVCSKETVLGILANPENPEGLVEFVVVLDGILENTGILVEVSIEEPEVLVEVLGCCPKPNTVAFLGGVLENPEMSVVLEGILENSEVLGCCPKPNTVVILLETGNADVFVLVFGCTNEPVVVNELMPKLDPNGEKPLAAGCPNVLVCVGCPSELVANCAKPLVAGCPNVLVCAGCPNKLVVVVEPNCVVTVLAGILKATVVVSEVPTVVCS